MDNKIPSYKDINPRDFGFLLRFKSDIRSSRM